MEVVLCQPHDTAALWLHGQLTTRCGRDIRLLTVEELIYSRRIVHRVSAEGDAGELEFAGGQILRPEAITGLVNRVAYVPRAHLAAAAPADAAYAFEELSAFVLAWLDGLPCRVINPARPRSLAGGGYHLAEIVQAAAIAGVPTGGWSWPQAQAAEPGKAARRLSVICFDGRLYGPIIPQALQQAAVRLGSLLGVPLLQLDFAVGPAGWQLTSVDALPDFRIGGTSLVRAIAGALARQP